ncbi:MAG TPA: hypothetical protein GXX60_08400 [Anaerolineaceae bacterium]|nr:hypothetical protein [Anaerolineaceae bacterium]
MKTKFKKHSKICVFLGCLFVSMLIFSACKTVQAEINPYTKMTWKTEEWVAIDKNNILFTVENPRWNRTESSIDISWSLPEGNGDWTIWGENYVEINGKRHPINRMQLLSGVRTDLRGGQQTIDIDEDNRILAGHLDDTEKVDTYIKYRIFLDDVAEDFTKQTFSVYIEKLFFIPIEGSQYDPEYLEAVKKLLDEIQPGIELKPFEYVIGLEAVKWPNHLTYEEAQLLVSQVEASLSLDIPGPWVVEYTP